MSKYIQANDEWTKKTVYTEMTNILHISMGRCSFKSENRLKKHRFITDVTTEKIFLNEFKRVSVFTLQRSGFLCWVDTKIFVIDS